MRACSFVLAAEQGTAVAQFLYRTTYKERSPTCVQMHLAEVCVCVCVCAQLCVSSCVPPLSF